MLTPPEVARRFGVASDKVLHWIHTGQLRAVNTAHDPTGRPRFRVSVEALRQFEESRMTRPPIKRRRRRREAVAAGKEYF